MSNNVKYSNKSNLGYISLIKNVMYNIMDINLYIMGDVNDV